MCNSKFFEPQFYVSVDRKKVIYRYREPKPKSFRRYYHEKKHIQKKPDGLTCSSCSEITSRVTVWKKYYYCKLKKTNRAGMGLLTVSPWDKVCKKFKRKK